MKLILNKSLVLSLTAFIFVSKWQIADSFRSGFFKKVEVDESSFTAGLLKTSNVLKLVSRFFSTFQVSVFCQVLNSEKS
jgi:hypothetical protein